MSLVLIGQIWFCLLSAFALGLFVGWLCKQLASAQKRPTPVRQEEILTQEQEHATKERETTTIQINALRTQVEIVTTALQSREAALAKLETDLIEQFATLSAATAQTEKLQTRLASTETALQQNTQSATTLEEEVHTLRNELMNKDLEGRQMFQRLEGSTPLHEKDLESENRIAELTEHFHSLLHEKEIAIRQLQTQVATLEPLSAQLSECTSTLQEAETYYQAAVRDKDAEIIRLQAQVSSLKLSESDIAATEIKMNELKTRHQATLREKDVTLARLQARIAGLELLLQRKNDRSAVSLQALPSVHHHTPTSFPRELLTTGPRVLTTDLTEIKSLDDEAALKLSHAGITTRALLLEKGSSVEGRSEISNMTGIPLPLIVQWVRHADLLRLNGMSGIYAELLNAVGIDSVSELTKCTAETLHQKFIDVNATKRLSRILPILTQIRDWIEQAKGLPYSNEELQRTAVGQVP